MSFPTAAQLAEESKNPPAKTVLKMNQMQQRYAIKRINEIEAEKHGAIPPARNKNTWRHNDPFNDIAWDRAKKLIAEYMDQNPRAIEAALKQLIADSNIIRCVHNNPLENPQEHNFTIELRLPGLQSVFDVERPRWEAYVEEQNMRIDELHAAISADAKKLRDEIVFSNAQEILQKIEEFAGRDYSLPLAA